jgi:hypothetical protein
MHPILAAFAAVPRAIDAMEKVAAALEGLGKQMREAEASRRRGAKDDEVDDAIERALSGDDQWLPDTKEVERKPPDF